MRHSQVPVRSRVSAETAAANRRTVDALLQRSTIGDLPTQLANALQSGGDDAVNDVADLFQQLEARDLETSARLGEGLASQLKSLEKNDGKNPQNTQVAYAGLARLLGLLLGGGAAAGGGEHLRREYERQRKKNEHKSPPGLIPPPPLTPNRTPENRRPKEFETTTKTPPQTQEPQGFPGTKGPIPESRTPQVLIGPSVDDIVQDLPVYENRGNDRTKNHIDIVRDWFLAHNPRFKHMHGGREQGSQADKKELWIPSSAKIFGGDGRPGGRFVDLTFKNLETGQVVHIQTVDIDKNGKVTAREQEAAEAIRRATGATVILIPKPWQVEKLRR